MGASDPPRYARLLEAAKVCREAAMWRGKCVNAVADMFEGEQPTLDEDFLRRLREARRVEEQARAKLADAQDALLATAMGFVPFPGGSWLRYWCDRLDPACADEVDRHG